MNLDITDKNLYLLLPSKISWFVQLYLKEHEGSVVDAVRVFYQSETYRELEKEETKMWHLGPVALYEEYMKREPSKAAAG